METITNNLNQKQMVAQEAADFVVKRKVISLDSLSDEVDAFVIIKQKIINQERK